MTPSQWSLLCLTEGVPLAYNVIPVVGKTRDGEDVRALTLSAGGRLVNRRTSKRYYDIIMEGAKGYGLKELREYMENEVTYG